MAAVGTPVKIGELVFTVVRWHTSGGDKYEKPAKGMQYAIVEYELANNGSRSFFFDNKKMLFIRTPDGHKYYTTNDVYRSEDGNTSQGFKRSGEIGFEVPAKGGRMDFVFQPSKGNTATIKLQ